jgi:two-component sensor histidine kinase
MVRKARDEAEAEVHASRDRYAALAAEREVLLREVNHRVGNSLQIIASLLHLQANSTTQDDVKAALTNAMGRVAAVAQVHRRLYTSHDLKSVLLNQYLEALLEDLRRSAEGNKMSRLTLKAEPIEIDPDRAVAIGIIVNELVMNAVKYAYPDGAGPIHVELKPDGDDLVVAIADDGVGLNAKTDPRSTGMGQRIVSAMAAKLDATAERDPDHHGTRIVLRFRRIPAAAPKPTNAAAAGSLRGVAASIARAQATRTSATSIARRGLILFRMAESVIAAAGWPSGVRIQAESDFVPCTRPTSRRL